MMQVDHKLMAVAQRCVIMMRAGRLRPLPPLVGVLVMFIVNMQVRVMQGAMIMHKSPFIPRRPHQ